MPLQILHDETAFSGRFLRVIRRHFTDRAGNPAVWELVQRKTHGPIVAVLPVTPQREILLVRIWRVPARSYVLELCAGLMDREGEAPEDAARRELLEETGHQSAQLEVLMSGPFNAGLTQDEMVVYLARDAIKVAEPTPEATEDLEVVRVPINGALHLLQHPPDGTKVDIKLFGALSLLLARENP